MLACCAAMLFPAALWAEATTYWYVPHYMASVEEAANRLQFMAPQMAPMERTPQGGFTLTAGFTLQRAQMNKLGINLTFTRSGVVQSTQYFWSWTGGYNAPVTTPYKDDLTVSIVYADVAYVKVLFFPKSTMPNRWCAVPMNKGEAGRNDILCVATEADVHALIDALSTVIVASGEDAMWQTGMTLEPIPDKDLKKHPEKTGCLVREVQSESPAEAAGMKVDDIVHEVDGKPCADVSVFGSALSADVIGKPGGGVVHVDVLRKGKPLALDLRYPELKLDAAKLKQSAEELAQKGSQAGTNASAGNGAGVHFGFEVRAVADADVATYELSKARGIVVVDVAKDSLAARMGFQPGDVILEVNNSAIGDVTPFVQFVRSGEVKRFQVWRKGQTLQLVVPETL